MLTAGVTFAIGQFVVSNFVGPELTDSLAALFSLASVALLLKFWHPKDGYTDGVQIAGRSHARCRSSSRVARLRAPTAS